MSNSREKKWKGKIYKYLKDEITFEGEYLDGEIWDVKGKIYDAKGYNSKLCPL